MNIFILTDLNKKTGYGHVMRCLSLATYFKYNDYSISFCINGEKLLYEKLNINYNAIFCCWSSNLQIIKKKLNYHL